MTTLTSYDHDHPSDHPHRRPLYWRIGKPTLMTLGVLLVILIAIRAYLPFWIKDNVNETLNNIPGYSGSVADIDLALYRGAYVIHGLKINKKDKNIPVSFVDIDKTDLSLQWGALFRGEVVGDVTMTRPIINFATGKTGTSQTGVETDWTVPIKALMPLDINWVEIKDGTINYKDFSSVPNVDLYIKDMYLKATNLRNVEDKNNALPSDITVRGTSIGAGRLAIEGKVNILKRIPDADITGKLETVNMPALNDYARSFAGVDFSKGTFNLYSDLNIKDGRVSGFVKPIATGIELIDVEKESNPINLLWESAVSVFIEIFENQPKDQFATQIALEGTIDNPDTNFWSTLRGIFRNAFVKAYSKTVTPE